MIIQPMNPPTSARGLNGMAALPRWGVIRVQGGDAQAFLQGQLTQDVAQPPPGAARLAGWCNPKGRLLASFVACKRSPQEFWLACSGDLLAATLKKLALFVLRAQVRLADASGELALYGLIGEAANSIAAIAPGADSFLAPLPPADGAARALWIAPASRPAPPCPALPAALWDWAAVRSGVATVTAPVAGAFVPQMLNYESVDAVSFGKGCYPGQEVVARSQFRGAIKRRAFVGQVNGPAQAGQEIFAPAGVADDPAGLIAQAAPAPEGGTAVIASLPLAAAEAGGDLRVGSPDGPPLAGLRLPYPLREDI
jgi:folate-binding protein YgfZ